MSHTSRQLQIAIALRKADPSMSAVDAIARAVPLEARGKRQQFLKYMPWWSWLAHLALVFYTHGGWLAVVAIHLVWTRYQIEKWIYR